MPSITLKVWNNRTLSQNRSLQNSKRGVQWGGKIHSRNAITTYTDRRYDGENPLRTQKGEQTIEVEYEKKGVPLYG
jgi:hypothetical protein